MKYLIIVNSKCYKRRRFGIQTIMDAMAKGFKTELVFTEYKGHATEIARNSTLYDTVVVAGGDGTIGEVVNGLDLSRQNLAIIPLGTGNNLARDLKINPSNAVDVAERGLDTEIDLIKCNVKSRKNDEAFYVASTAGLGFTSSCASLANRYFKCFGPACYHIAGCVTTFYAKPITGSITIDGGQPKTVALTNLILNNSKHAGNLCVFPNAKLSDERFDLFMDKANILTQSLWNISIFTKQFYCGSRTQSAKSCSIKLDSPADLMVDGEVLKGILEVDFRIMPKALRLRVPQENENTFC